MDILKIIETLLRFIIDSVNKPGMMFLYCVVLLIICFFVGYKLYNGAVAKTIEGFKTTTLALEKKLDGMIDSVSFIIDSIPKIELINENFSSITKAIDINEISNISVIYSLMKVELEDLRKRFLVIYNNGSERCKATETYTYSKDKLINMIGGASIKASYRKGSYLLLIYIFNRIENLVSELTNANSFTASDKINLVTVRFSSYKNLVDSFKINDTELIMLQEDILKVKLVEIYKSVCLMNINDSSVEDYAF
jgi:hypothetical protein